MARRVRLGAPFVVVFGGFAIGCPGPAASSAAAPAEATSQTAQRSSGPSHPRDAADASPLNRDGDTIGDDEDECLLDPENFNDHEDQDGCPERVVITSSNPPAVTIIHFEGDTPTPNPDAAPALDEIARVMREHPEILLVQIEGHADTAAPKQLATASSKMRADAIKAELVRRGVEASRLRTVGLGAYCPVDEGPSPERAKRNRRVEFKAVRLDPSSGLKPLGEQGCAPAREAGLVGK